MLTGVPSGWQRRICRSSTASHDVENDRLALLATDPRLSVGVLPLPMGIDPLWTGAVRREEAGLLFVGAMHRDANVDAVSHFCREILPRVRAEVPAVTFTIVGGEPSEEVAAGGPAGVASRVRRDTRAALRSATVFSAMRIKGG